MKRATLGQVLDRRRDMLMMNRLGVQPKEWVPVVASKHGANEEAVKKDWSKRKEWMKVILKINDVEALALDTLNHYEVTLLDSYKLFEEIEDPKLKIQTVWLRIKAIKLKEDFLRDLGALDYIRTDFRAKANKHDKEHILDFL